MPFKDTLGGDTTWTSTELPTNVYHLHSRKPMVDNFKRLYCTTQLSSREISLTEAMKKMYDGKDNYSK